MANVKGCLLVGSVPMKDTREVLETCSKAMPGRLKRIPDGETGVRNNFVVFQAPLFPESVFAQIDIKVNKPPEPRDLTEEQISEGFRALDGLGELKTGYDDSAIESYETFKQLKKEGVLPRDIKFQVCIPTLGNVVGAFIDKAFQQKAEEVYEPALLKALRNVQDKIPHEDLAIQLDIAVDMLYWLDAWGTPWFGDKSHIVEYIAKMVNHVDSDVDLGFHFCYGDLNHKHFTEPESLAGVVSMTTSILDKCQRKATFMHCPVPLSAGDKLDGYFEPLKALIPRLRQDGTELYLGVVHAHKKEMTQKMIEAAGKVTQDFEFGVGTECGWGRTPAADLDSVMEISAAVSNTFLQN